MENVIEVIFVFIAIGAGIFSSASKAKKRREAEERCWAASPVKPKAAAPKASHPYTAQPAVMPPMAFGDVPGQVIAPTLHTHLQPDCETHDAPGSLGAVSAEGKDPCHEEQLTHARSSAESVQEEGGMTFDWSGENMAKAFVMQEVLTRPCQRHAR